MLTKRPLWVWPTLVLALLAVSSAGMVLQEMRAVPPWLRASWRMQATAVVLLLPFLWQLYAMRPTVQLRDLGWLAASSLCLALHFGAWVWSLDHTSLVHSLLFVTAHPLVMVALLPLWKQAVTPAHLGGVGFGMAGALLLVSQLEDDGAVTIAGDLAAFGGAVAVVGYLLIGRHLRSDREMPLFVYAFPVTLGAGGWLALAAWRLEEVGFHRATPAMELGGWLDASWVGGVAYLALGPGLCGHTGLNAVVRWLSPLVVSVALLTEPILGSLLGWLWIGTPLPGLWTWVGGSLLLLGALWITLADQPRAEPP